MKPRLIFLQTLVPLLEEMARCPDPELAAEAAEEHAKKANELAKLRRSMAKTEGVISTVAMQA